MKKEVKHLQKIFTQLLEQKEINFYVKNKKIKIKL